MLKVLVFTIGLIGFLFWVKSASAATTYSAPFTSCTITTESAPTRDYTYAIKVKMTIVTEPATKINGQVLVENPGTYTAYAADIRDENATTTRTVNLSGSHSGDVFAFVGSYKVTAWNGDRNNPSGQCKIDPAFTVSLPVCSLRYTRTIYSSNDPPTEAIVIFSIDEISHSRPSRTVMGKIKLVNGREYNIEVTQRTNYAAARVPRDKNGDSFSFEFFQQFSPTSSPIKCGAGIGVKACTPLDPNNPYESELDCTTVPGTGRNPCGSECQTAIGKIPTTPIGFVTQILKIALGIAGGVALIIMVVGSIKIILSSGDQQKLQNGREMIIAGIAGLLFIIFSVIILRVLQNQIVSPNTFL